MDKNSIKSLREQLSSPSVKETLKRYFDEKIAILDSVTNLDETKPNIGLQALAQRKAVNILSDIRDEILGIESTSEKESFR